MNYPLLLTTVGLLFALFAMERLAALGLRANRAVWHAHYAAIPATAIITAEMRWNRDTWVTAFVDPSCNAPGGVRLIALRPMTSLEYAACLRWLRAEGFADPALSNVGGKSSPPPREPGA